MNTEKKLRMTPQRQIILEELQAVRTHPSADEIYAMVRKRLPRISLGTVYRNLEILSALGKIQRLEAGGALRRFDGNPEAHYHIRCTCCGKMVDAPCEILDNLEEKLNGADGFAVFGHSLEFLGLCPQCREQPIAPGLGKLNQTTR
ncbi:MAG: transcriptional repressor [Desulfobacterales bacterium]